MQVQTRNLAARELWMKGSCFFIDPGARRRDKGKGSEYKSITIKVQKNASAEVHKKRILEDAPGKTSAEAPSKETSKGRLLG
jgi:hypothetical protein